MLRECSSSAMGREGRSRKLLAGDVLGGERDAGCTVAPAFEFSAFEMGDKQQLLGEFPAAAAWIERLMAE